MTILYKFMLIVCLLLLPIAMPGCADIDIEPEDLLGLDIPVIADINMESEEKGTMTIYLKGEEDGYNLDHDQAVVFPITYSEGQIKGSNELGNVNAEVREGESNYIIEGRITFYLEETVTISLGISK